MTYYVNKTDGTAIVVLDGTKDISSTSLTLLGKLSSNYGENQNENFVRLLENFAYSSSPANPITGQLWYDTKNKVIKVFDTSSNTWIGVGQTIKGNVTLNGNLFVGASGFEIQEYQGNVKLINNTSNGNVSLFVNVAGVSTQVLNLQGSTGLITVAGNATNNLGITTKSYVDSLNDILTANAASQATLLTALNANVNSLTSNLSSLTSNVTSGSGAINAKEIAVNGNVVIDNSGTGNTAVNFKTPGGVTVLSASGSSSGSTPVTILGQWALGSGASINALYADLAEYYSSDDTYEAGTVMVFGGSAEVTQSTTENDIKLAGVVSTNPAFVMNDKLEGTRCCIALQGRIPCKIIGPVAKGDMLTTSSIPGHAQKANHPVLGSIIGKALENYELAEPGIIEVSVGRP